MVPLNFLEVSQLSFFVYLLEQQIVVQFRARREYGRRALNQYLLEEVLELAVQLFLLTLPGGESEPMQNVAG